MPGRAFIGLSPGERHRAEFEPTPLPDEPEITVWLVAGAVLVALAVFLLGWLIHQPALESMRIIRQGPNRGLCPYGIVPNERAPACPLLNLRWWSRIPMTVWFVYAVLAGTLVMIAPFLVYRVKCRTGQV